MQSPLVKVFCDESRDHLQRVFTLAGFIAEENEWARLADLWKERCLKDGIECYHATDCAGQWKHFSHLSQTQCTALNTDLITYMTETKLWGFAVSIGNQDYLSVSESSKEAKEILGSSPYVLGMQLLALRMCNELLINNPDYSLAFFFDRNEEVSGQAKMIWDELKEKNPELSPCLGSLAYDDKCRLVPLQVADELAYETMKNALAWTEGRKDRKPIVRMKEAKILHSLEFLGKKGLEGIVRQQSKLLQ